MLNITLTLVGFLVIGSGLSPGNTLANIELPSSLKHEDCGPLQCVGSCKIGHWQITNRSVSDSEESSYLGEFRLIHEVGIYQQVNITIVEQNKKITRKLKIPWGGAFTLSQRTDILNPQEPLVIETTCPLSINAQQELISNPNTSHCSVTIRDKRQAASPSSNATMETLSQKVSIHPCADRDNSLSQSSGNLTLVTCLPAPKKQEKQHKVAIITHNMIAEAGGTTMVAKNSPYTTLFTLNKGYKISESDIGGTCPKGVLSQNQYKSSKITQDCTIILKAKPSGPCPSEMGVLSFKNDIIPILQSYKCTGCHFSDNAEKAYFSEAEDAPPIHSYLLEGINKKQATNIVKANHPEQSWLYLKMTEKYPGPTRMPLGGKRVGQLLTYPNKNELNKVCNWIHQGALNN